VQLEMLQLELALMQELFWAIWNPEMHWLQPVMLQVLQFPKVVMQEWHTPRLLRV
jgi:hypothetical protein